MPFLRDDDFVLLFDPPDSEVEPSDHGLTRTDLRRLADAGMKTIVTILPWNRIERRPGDYDWAWADQKIDDARQAGLKTLLITYSGAVTWAPSAWYAKDRDGALLSDPMRLSMISRWNREAQGYANGFIQRTIGRYSADDVCCVPGLCREGEYVLAPYDFAYFDRSAIESFSEYARRVHQDDLTTFNAENGTSFRGWTEVIPATQCCGDTREWLRRSIVEYAVNQHEMFAPAHGEIWTMLSRFFPWESGTFCLDEIYRALHEKINAKIYGIQFVHFPHGKVAQKALDDQVQHGIPMFAGSEWAEGLERHTPLAIAQGLRGLITAPLHPFNGHKKLEKWMIDAVARSVRTFEHHRSVAGPHKPK